MNMPVMFCLKNKDILNSFPSKSVLMPFSFGDLPHHGHSENGVMLVVIGNPFIP